MFKSWLVRAVLGATAFTAAGILSLPWLLSSQQIEHLANRFLSPDYAIQLPEKWQMQSTGLQLPVLQIKSSQCAIIELQQVKLTWWNLRRLEVGNAVVDYACLTQLPSSDNAKTVLNLTALLGNIPASEVDIAQLRWINTESLSQPQLRQLLNLTQRANAKYDGNKLSFAVQGVSADNQSAVVFQHNSELTRQNGQFLWQGQTDYQPEVDQQYHLQFSTQLDNALNQLPVQGNTELSWDNPHFPAPTGELQLSWQDENGQLTARDLNHNQPLFDVPFTLTKNGLDITWGTLYWTFDGYQPIKGFLGLAVRKPEDAWLPLKTDVNMILQTFGEFGKGEIVISGKNGEIGGGEKQDKLTFDLKTKGDLRYNNTVANTNLDYKIRGNFADPQLIFRQGSIFKMDNIQPDSKIHVRLPLDDILIGRYGLEGRLQATLQGFTPQFENLDLKLDGQAHEFIAGIKTVFDLRDKKQNLRAVENHAANRWDWDIQGSAYWKALKTKVGMNGAGFWQADHIELNRLAAHSGTVHTAGVKMAPISLTLKDRLRWDYEADKFRGLLQAKSDWIEFDYGGRFVRPVFGVGIDGKSINNFNLAGDLKAGTLGPIDVLAHYEKQALRGKIAWKEQSAKVFQTLFPQQWEWVIHHGSIKGATDFVIDHKGVLMDGELNVQNGEISLPDGEIEGLKIRFPLHYQDYSLQAKANKPIQFFAENIRFGALEAHQSAFNLHGHYPNTAAKPLIITQGNIGVFDGTLTVDELHLPQQKMAVLNLHHIDLAKVLEMAQYNQIYMQGRINASLPFWLNRAECLICNGTITQATPLNIKLNDNVAKGLKSGGWTESILVDVIKNMNLDSFGATVNLAPTGMMNLAATLTGYNPDKQTHNPITLNYTHKENMFELWDMIDYGSQFEQNLEYKLYQQAEKH